MKYSKWVVSACVFCMTAFFATAFIGYYGYKIPPSLEMLGLATAFYGGELTLSFAKSATSEITAAKSTQNQNEDGSNG